MLELLLRSHRLGCRGKARITEAVPATICASQRPAMFHRVPAPGIMMLLKAALAAQKGRFRAVLCGACAQCQL